MKPHEIRALVRLRRPLLASSSRTLRDCATIADLRRVAHRRWPAGVEDYVEGGSDGEIALAANRAAYEHCHLVPRVLSGAANPDTTSTLVGALAAAPFALAPTGYTQMMHHAGERAVARAAEAAQLPYTLSTMATTSIEDVRAAAPDAQLWFQLYIWRDRELTRDLVRRAQQSGYQALMITVDTPVTGLRIRDIHNGFTIPPQLRLRTVADMARHPAWWANLLSGEPVTFANIPGHTQDPAGVMATSAAQFDPTVTWRDLAEIRALWQGPLLIKGILNPRDALTAVKTGVDAIVLSNHGGRQLDRAIPPLAVLPAVRTAVGEDVEILIDSGIRHGADIATALALGANGCLVGRPYLYGLGAAGQRGVSHAISLLSSELRRTMQLLGVSSLAQLKAVGTELLDASRLGLLNPATAIDPNSGE